MSATSVTVVNDAAIADISIAAGTDSSFTPDGVEIPSGLHLADAGESDFRIRPQVTLKTRNPKLVNGVWQKGKRWLTTTIPRQAADGSYYYDVVRSEIEIHPETSAADAEAHELMHAQMFWDSDLTSFRRTGDLS
jgi:hypothetical protein